MTNINLSGRSLILMLVSITSVGCLLWVGGLSLFWLLMRLVGVSIDLWAMIEALSTAVAAAAVLSAGFMAYRELSESASSRHMVVADRLYETLNSKENIEARRWVFQNLPADPQEGLKMIPPEGRAAVKQVLNSLDRVAFLTQSGWIPEEMVMPWMNPMIVKAWIKLEPYVDYESTRRLEPDYYESVRQLARRCLTWRAENLPEAKITWIGEDAL
ncbi:MAG TPA: DUF4760 domain-containing protein [Anaerolineales bacterium]|nr:DUF4760 domain-containing protein [Anaerolineales bacterium]